MVAAHAGRPRDPLALQGIVEAPELGARFDLRDELRGEVAEQFEPRRIGPHGRGGGDVEVALELPCDVAPGLLAGALHERVEVSGVGGALLEQIGEHPGGAGAQAQIAQVASAVVMMRIGDPEPPADAAPLLIEPPRDLALLELERPQLLLGTDAEGLGVEVSARAAERRDLDLIADREDGGPLREQETFIERARLPSKQPPQ